jgi:transposase InsO family protein
MSVSGQASWSTWMSRSWAASPTVAATGSTAGLLPSAAGGSAMTTCTRPWTTAPESPSARSFPTRPGTSARFLVEAAGFFAEHGVTIQRVLTDNAKAYADSVVFAETAAGLGIRRKRIRPYRPQTNGKVERFNKTLLDEWAYGRLYRSNDERCRAFTRWLRSYNHRRPPTSLDGLTPMAVLVNNAGGQHT